MVSMRKASNWRLAYLLILSTSLVLTFWSISIAFSSSDVVVQYVTNPTAGENNSANLTGKNIDATRAFDRKPSYPWIGDPQCQNFVVQVYLELRFLVFKFEVAVLNFNLLLAI